ncbi:MAG: beta-propeller domain-containing protein [Campylobacterota bacterium]|nr:beta-propeller domain-containing protein [Campylobacterota bacterium]
MKKIIIALLFLSVFLFGSTNIIIKSGWQLIGLNHDVDNISIFDAQNVDQVWVYDATTQQWSGYSPNAQTLAKILDSHTILSKIDKWQGVWIKSHQEWTLTQETPSQSNDPIDTLELKKGWNLISIPLDSVVSPKLFDDALVWKYYNNDWEIYDRDEPSSVQPIESIKSSDGIWIKVEDDTTIDISKQSASLQTFASQEEMKSYLETLLSINHYYPMPYDEVTSGMPTPAPTAAPTYDTTTTSNDAKEADDTTSTNLQEEGVDEANTIQNDGTYVYYLNRNTNIIEIRSFGDLVNNSTQPLATIDLNGEFNTIDSFYLYNNKLITISNTSYYYIQNTEIATDYYGNTNKLLLTVYDVSDIENITNLESFVLDTNLISSRIVENKLMLVSNFTPSADFEYPKIYLEGMEECRYDDPNYPTPKPMPVIETTTNSSGSADTLSSDTVVTATQVPVATTEIPSVIEPYYYDYPSYCYGINFDSDRRAYQYDYDNPITTNTYLIPQLSSSKYSGDLLSYQSFYAPLKQDQTATITILSAFDLDTLEYIKSSAIVGNSNIVYASTNSLYTISQEYPIFFNYNAYQERSVIYKFDIDSLEFAAMGFINGHALNQFSLSEYNNVLRVATTEGSSWSGDTTNSIFTLQESGYDLNVAGYLGSLGKEGETIHSVRFMADKGFVVTFRQTDPLYTLDLSNPLNPQKVGELEIDGFSQYMHIVDENRLLTIGRDANNEGVQQGISIQLFNISDFANPTLADKITIGDNSYYSEALYDHKAFIYRNSDKLFGFDYNSYNNYYTNYFGLYQINDMSLKAIETLSLANTSYSCNPRSVVFDYEAQSYISYFCGGNFITKTLSNEEQ